MRGVWAVLAALIFLTVAAVLISRLASENRTKTHALFGYPALGFGFVIGMMMLDAGGIRENPDALTDAMMWVMILFVLILCVYIGVVLVDSKKTYALGTPKYFFAQLIALIIISGMILLGGAYWEFSFFEQEAQTTASTGYKLAQMLWAYPLFLIFFAGPRLLFLAKNFRMSSLISALASIAYYVWHSLSFIA
jgi:hypothetical protein